MRCMLRCIPRCNYSDMVLPHVLDLNILQDHIGMRIMLITPIIFHPWNVIRKFRCNIIRRIWQSWFIWYQNYPKETSKTKWSALCNIMFNHVAHFYCLEIEFLKCEDVKQDLHEWDHDYLIFVQGMCDVYQNAIKPKDTSIFDLTKSQKYELNEFIIHSQCQANLLCP